MHAKIERTEIMIKKIKNNLKSRLSRFVKNEIQLTVDENLPLLARLVAYQNSSKEDRQNYYDHTKDSYGNRDLYGNLKDRLVARGVNVEEVDIDISDFEDWLKGFNALRDHYHNMGDVFIEKCLEHYLAFRHLGVSQDDIVIDIAAAGSPFIDILNNKGIKSYRLDLSYPEGIHGNNIGADCGDTQLPDAFATVLTVHCAYECFMGDADVHFVREANRILKLKGKYGIVPLYLDDTYFVATSPYCNQDSIIVEAEAKKVWREDKYKVPFSRHYSPESFQNRIYSKIPINMKGKVFYFRNLPDVMKRYPDQRIYCFFMFYCEKGL